MKNLFIAVAMLLCITELNIAYAATCEPGYYLGNDGICIVRAMIHVINVHLMVQITIVQTERIGGTLQITDIIFHNFGQIGGETYHSVKPCTNAPENVFYTGPGTLDSEIVDANNCPWQCMDGYGPISNNTCALLCTAGVRKLYVGNTVWAALFDEKRTSSAIHISVNNKMCYVDLVPGNMPGTINVQYNASVYHTVAQE